MAKRKGTRALARVQRTALVKTTAPDTLSVFERLAKDPALTVEKLSELVKLQQHIRAIEAETAFDAAFLAMQPTIPRIGKRGIIKNKQGQVQSRYSKYEDIRRIVDPILQRHGFHTHNRTEWPETGVVEVVGMLTHDRGHTRSSRFRAAADESGGKNAIQGLGSAVSYGRRYTLIDLLSIVCEGQDDDGQLAGAKTTVDAPIVHAQSGEPITVQMRDRLVRAVDAAGRDRELVRRWLAESYGVSSTSEIRRDQYESIMRAIERPGGLSRQPGEEG